MPEVDLETREKFHSQKSLLEDCGPNVMVACESTYSQNIGLLSRSALSKGLLKRCRPKSTCDLSSSLPSPNEFTAILAPSRNVSSGESSASSPSQPGTCKSLSMTQRRKNCREEIYRGSRRLITTGRVNSATENLSVEGSYLK